MDSLVQIRCGSRFCVYVPTEFDMHPKTAVCLAALEKSRQDVALLQRRLARIAAYLPPIYWQLDTDILRLVSALQSALDTQKAQLLAAQEASEAHKL